jgi:predicted nucleotidyltransferase
MVYGLDTFLQYFKDFKDQYVLIGGSACDIVMQEYDIDFRSTKDLDIVLIIETLNTAFV